MHPFCGAPDCPDDFPSDFSGLTSMVTTGAGTSTTGLVTIETGRAYRYAVGIRIGDGAPLPLDGVDLTRSDLVSPGDVDGDGIPDLWVRDRTSGTVTQFLGTATGFSPTGTVVADQGFLGPSRARPDLRRRSHGRRRPRPPHRRQRLRRARAPHHGPHVGDGTAVAGPGHRPRRRRGAAGRPLTVSRGGVVR